MSVMEWQCWVEGVAGRWLEGGLLNHLRYNQLIIIMD